MSRHKRARRTALVLAAGVSLLGPATASTWVRAYADAPSSSYAVTTMAWKNDPRGVHVVTFGGPDYRLRLVSAHDVQAGSGETVSAMCARVHCLAGVNGDFFASGEAVGDLAAGCKLLHTRQTAHEVVDLGAHQGLHVLQWKGTVTLPSGAGQAFGAVNTAVSGVTQVLYSAGLGRPTRHGSDVTDFVFTVTGGGQVGELRRHVRLALASVRKGGASSVPARGAVVSVRGRTGLSALHLHDTVDLVVTANAGCSFVGAHPVVLEGGRAARTDPNDRILYTRYARSAVGWRADGTTVLVTVDGLVRDGHGATIREMVQLLQRLHVVDAVNLDGGGSTTFVSGGRVVNTPNGGEEHPVHNGVLVTHT